MMSKAWACAMCQGSIGGLAHVPCVLLSRGALSATCKMPQARYNAFLREISRAQLGRPLALEAANLRIRIFVFAFVRACPFAFGFACALAVGCACALAVGCALACPFRPLHVRAGCFGKNLMG